MLGGDDGSGAAADDCSFTSGAKDPASSTCSASLPLRASRRHAVTCRRATSLTRAPRSKLSATIRAFTASGQLRRPVGPAITSSRSITLRRPINKNCALSYKAVVPSVANHDANGTTYPRSRQSGGRDAAYAPEWTQTKKGRPKGRREDAIAPCNQAARRLFRRLAATSTPDTPSSNQAAAGRGTT